MASHGPEIAGRAASPPGAVVLLYNLIFWPYLLASVFVLFWPALAIFLATFAFDPRRRLLHRYTSFWGGHYLAWAPYAGVVVEGREHVPPGEACVFVSNHQ